MSSDNVHNRKYNNKHRYSSNKIDGRTNNSVLQNSKDGFSDGDQKNIDISDIRQSNGEFNITPDNIDDILKLLTNMEIEKISILDETEMTESLIGLLKILIPMEIDRLRKVLLIDFSYNDKIKYIRDLLAIHKMNYPDRHKMIILDHMINEKLYKRQNITEYDLNDSFKSCVTTYIIPRIEGSDKYNQNIASKRVIFNKNCDEMNSEITNTYDLDFNFPDNIPENISRVLKHGIETVIEQNLSSISQVTNISLGVKKDDLPEYKNVYTQNTKGDSSMEVDEKKKTTTTNNTNTNINVDLRGTMINDIQLEVNNNSNVRLYLVGRDAIHNIDRFVMSDILLKSNDSTIIYFLKSSYKYPEYYDIYFPELERKYILKYDGSVWHMCDTESINNDMHNGDITLIEINIKRFIKNLSDSEKNAFAIWMTEDNFTHDSKRMKNVIKEKYSDLL